MVQNATVRKYTRRCITVKTFMKLSVRKTETIIKKVLLLVRSPKQVIILIFIPLICFVLNFPSQYQCFFFFLCYLFFSRRYLRLQNSQPCVMSFLLHHSIPIKYLFVISLCPYLSVFIDRLKHSLEVITA